MNVDGLFLAKYTTCRSLSWHLLLNTLNNVSFVNIVPDAVGSHDNNVIVHNLMRVIDCFYTQILLFRGSVARGTTLIREIETVLLRFGLVNSFYSSWVL